MGRGMSSFNSDLHVAVKLSQSPSCTVEYAGCEAVIPCTGLFTHPVKEFFQYLLDPNAIVSVTRNSLLLHCLARECADHPKFAVHITDCHVTIPRILHFAV